MYVQNKLINFVVRMLDFWMFNLTVCKVTASFICIHILLWL